MLNAVPATPQWEPPALPADVRQIRSGNRYPDSVQYFSPFHTSPLTETQQIQHAAILVLYPLLRGVPVERTAGRSLVRAGSTDSVRRIHHFNNPFMIVCQFSMDAGEVIDEFGTVALALKALQAEQRVASEPDRLRSV
jgi:hypothetical protein